MASDSNQKPALPGYQFVELLGTGGCGEVWRADAPGGIAKAVKCVYGQCNERRAETELRALERIKEVRHPFLLSLERIEVVDSRLYVVSELADESLRDRMQHCLEDGLRGIPRDELLMFMREAAEALDFLNDQFDLQHLDIKPENLLILAGHVKVADFGLVKQLDATQASMVGGLTPNYAAPELFQSMPGRHSDQYSLAIMYHELMTGIMPFSGSTVAELTMQHLHHEPSLEHLDEDDRYVVSRALAKEPGHRFASCREFVSALASGKKALDSTIPAEPTGATPTRRTTSRRSGGQVADVTQFVEEAPIDTAPLRLELPPVAQANLMPPRAEYLEEFAATPTLVIAVGGTGELVLRGFRNRLVGIGGAEALDAGLKMLFIDTDPRTIARSTVCDDSARGMRTNETLCVPLSHPNEYREKSQKLLDWLSRRWLYNIPKSLQTDGLRPLGRLAFVDHSRQVMQRIRMALTELLEESATDVAETAWGKKFRRNAVHVKLVGSIAGGSASGMLIDLAYGVRAMLSRTDLEDVSVSCVATHSTGDDAQRNELARVNSFAWLEEYEHFRAPANAYPGDASAGLPAHDAKVAPVDQLHIVDLGRGLDSPRLGAAANAVGDFLALDFLAPLNHYFGDHSNTPASERGCVATFSVNQASLADTTFVEQLKLSTHRALASIWLDCGDDPRHTPSPAIEARASEQSQAASEFLARQRADISGAAAQAQRIIARNFGAASPLEVLQSKLGEAAHEQSKLSFEVGERFIDSILSGDENRERAMQQSVESAAQQVARDIEHWVREHLVATGMRLAGAELACRAVMQHLSQSKAQLETQIEMLATAVIELRDHERTHPSADATESLTACMRLRSEQLVAKLASRFVGRIYDNLGSVSESLTQLRRVLYQVFDDCEPQSASSEKSQAETIDRSVVSSLAAASDSSLEGLGDGESLVECVLQNSGRQFLQNMIRRTVTSVVGEHLTQQLTNQSCANFQTEFTLPALCRQGGKARLLAALPAGVPLNAVVPDRFARHSASVSLQGLDTGLLVHEIRGLSPLHTAAEFVSGRRDYAEFASRARCRNDIVWRSLLDQTTSSAPQTVSFPVASAADLVSG